MATDPVSRMRARRDAVVDDVAALVTCESPSGDAAALETCLDLVADMGERLTGRAPERRRTADHTHLVWHFGGAPRVLLIGHCDTVWPIGTIARWPFSIEGDRATGPGIFDMKAGLVQLFHALATLDDLTGVTVLVNSDEEIGSPTSRPLIEDLARQVRAALILEASAGGAVKTARKGVSLYQLEVTGKAAHAGLEPENGINATVEAAHQVLAIAALDAPDVGTTVTPSVLTSGTTANTVPAAAHLSVDSRARSRAEQERVDTALRALRPALSGATLRWTGGINRPPLEESASMALFDRAADVAATLGMEPLRHASVGGGSDGNFTAGVGTPTLDGLGAVGEHAHSEGEWASVSAMVERGALLAALVDSLRREPRIG